MDRTGSCPSCRRELNPDDSFCSQCGMKIKEDFSRAGLSRRTLLRKTITPHNRRVCGSCNAPLLEDEIFCTVCGARSGTASPGGHPTHDPRVALRRQLEETTEGRFEFIRELGRGGMGTVYLARELDLDRYVAIKALSANWLTDSAMVERFRREARVIASLRHPSIVRVHGVGKAENIHYFIMDFIEGVSLGRIIRTLGPMPLPAINAVFFQVGSALSYAHGPSRQVIHRDVKPSNIMVDEEANFYVTDFGISKVAEGQGGLTMTGLIMGTPEYMSPEQCRGDIATYASDQYALGVVIYTMLTGTPPFSGPHYRVLTGHTALAPPPIHDLRPECPTALADVVNRMLAKQPGDRWPDIADALSAAGVEPLKPQDPTRDEIVQLVHSTSDLEEGKTPSPGPKVSSDEAGPPGDDVTMLRIRAPQESLETGDEITLRATALLESGRETDGRNVVWESQDPAVARIDSTTGDLIAVGTGSTVITALTAGVRESIAVDVLPPRVTRLEVEPDWLEVEVGDTAAMTASAFSRRGKALPQPVSWSSSDPMIATVTGEGVAHAHEVGSATLLAHCQGVAAAAKVTVLSATVAQIQLGATPRSLYLGDSVALAADPRDGRGKAIDRPVFWSSSDPGILRVNEKGEVRAVASGSAHITVECGGQRASTSIMVFPAPVANVEISAPRSTVAVGENVLFHATAFDVEGLVVEGDIGWTSGDPSILHVNRDGWVRGVAPGAAEILATCVGVTTSVWIEVSLVPPTVAAPPTAVPYEVDQRETEHTPDEVLEPAHAVEEEGDPGKADPHKKGRGRLLWWGLPISAVTLGVALWLILGPGSGDTPPPTADPQDPVAQHVEILTPNRTPADEGLQLVVGDTVSLGATATTEGGDTVPGPDVTWTSGDPSRASIDADGRLIALAAGGVTITAATEEAGSQLEVTIGEPQVVIEDPPPGPGADRTTTAGEGQNAPDSTTTDIEPGPDLTPAAPDGTLQVRIMPGADRVEIIGVVGLDTANVRSLSIPLPEGEYRMNIQTEGRQTVDTTFSIVSNDTTRLGTIRLREGG